MKVLYRNVKEITDDIEVVRLKKEVIDQLKSDLAEMKGETIEDQGMKGWIAGYLAY
jgi:hypothetical protein